MKAEARKTVICCIAFYYTFDYFHAVTQEFWEKNLYEQHSVEEVYKKYWAKI